MVVPGVLYLWLQTCVMKGWHDGHWHILCHILCHILLQIPWHILCHHFPWHILCHFPWHISHQRCAFGTEAAGAVLLLGEVGAVLLLLLGAAGAVLLVADAVLLLGVALLLLPGAGMELQPVVSRHTGRAHPHVHACMHHNSIP